MAQAPRLCEEGNTGPQCTRTRSTGGHPWTWSNGHRRFMVPPWRTLTGAEPDAIQVARPVLNGAREETGEGPRLALTQLSRSRFRARLSASVRLLPYTHLTKHIENDLPLSSQTVYNRRMDIIYHLQGVEFEWDEEKARSNIADHGVTFEEAAEVFFDPFYQGGDASTEDEAREFIIGYSLAQRLLLVVYVDRGERTRIISARQATRPERKLYEEA